MSHLGRNCNFQEHIMRLWVRQNEAFACLPSIQCNAIGSLALLHVAKKCPKNITKCNTYSKLECTFCIHVRFVSLTWGVTRREKISDGCISYTEKRRKIFCTHLCAENLLQTFCNVRFRVEKHEGTPPQPARVAHWRPSSTNAALYVPPKNVLLHNVSVLIIWRALHTYVHVRVQNSENALQMQNVSIYLFICSLCKRRRFELKWTDA